MNRQGPFTVIVSFDTTPEEQDQALEEIGAYVESFLSRQPGFLRSWLHTSIDGTGLVHYAQWQSQADFQAAGAKAREHPALPGLMKYNPQGRQYEVARGFGDG